MSGADGAAGGSAEVPGEVDAVEALLVECVERAEKDGPAGVDEICARYPEHAETLRRELAILRELGLLGDGAQRSDGADGTGDAAGERIGDFRLIRRLGQGGMGVVLLAEQTSLRRLVALEVLRGGPGAAAGMATRFEREARSASRPVQRAQSARSSSPSGASAPRPFDSAERRTH